MILLSDMLQLRQPPEEEFVEPDLKVFAQEWRGFLISRQKNAFGRHRARCKTSGCHKILDGRLPALTKHKLRDCRRFPEEDKTVSCKRRILEDEGAGQSSAAPATVNTPTAKQPKLDKFLLPADTIKKAAVLFTKALITGSNCFRFANNPFIKQLFSVLGVPAVANRSYLADTIAPQLYHKLRVDQKSRLTAASNICVILDGWTDCSNIEYMAVILKCTEADGTDCNEYIGNVHLPEAHTSSHMATQLKTFLKEHVSLSQILSIVSDSAPSMKLMKNLLEADVDFPGPVFGIPCVLHVLNLVCKDFVKKMGATPQQAISLASFFNKSTKYGTVLKNWGIIHNIPRKIALFSPSRWFAFFEMCDTLSQYEQAFAELFDCGEELGRGYLKGMPEKIRNIISSPSFFGDVKWMATICKKLVGAIKRLEAENANISDIWPELIALHKHYKNLEVSAPSQRKAIMSSFVLILNNRCQVFDTELFVFSFFLNPQHRTVAQSKKYDLSIIKRAYLNILRKLKYPKALAMAAPLEVDNYSKGVGDFKGLKATSAILFWKSAPASTLKTVALKLLSILPHSANCERLFSIMNYMKKKSQNQMTKESLTAYTQLKLQECKSNASKRIVDEDIEEVVEECGEEDDDEELYQDIDDDNYSIELYDGDGEPLETNELISSLFDINTNEFCENDIVSEDENDLGWVLSDIPLQ